MPFPKTVTAPETNPVPPPLPVNKSLTKWEALKNFVVKELTCSAYPPIHKGDDSCHSRLHPTNAQQIVDHIKAGHSGAFQVVLEESTREFPLWKQLAVLGVEAQDFRCEICDKQIPFHTNHITPHMKPHTGKLKRIREGKQYNLTLTLGKASVNEDEAFEENG